MVSRKRMLSLTALGAMLLPAAGALASSDTGDAVLSAELSHRSYRNWKIELPQEQWQAVSGGIAIPHANGSSFAVAVEGADLKIDTTGDGQLDRTIRATPDAFGVKSARVVLKSTSADGSKLTYGVRLKDAGLGWTWAPGGAMVGTVETSEGPVKVQVIDRNGNGRFNDIGQDAIVIGRSNVATYLSQTVNFNNQLWQLDVDPNASSVRFAPYQGATAQFDMTSDFDSKARLMSAIVRSADGQHSFDLGRYEGPVDVPAGEYDIISGRIGLDKQSVRIAAGKARPISVTADELTTFNWGGPIGSEFDYLRQGEQVVFSPNTIWYYGEAGEEYLDWQPIGKSPEFKVIDKATGEVLEVLILPGSC